MKEIKDLQNPAQRYLNSLNIKYIHISKTTGRKYDWNKNNSGFPDLAIFTKGGHPIFIEFKLYTDLNTNQKDWLYYLKKNKYEYYIIHDIKDFYKLIDYKIGVKR